MTSGLVIRRATSGDAAIIARHRVAMFADMGFVPTDTLASQLLDSASSSLGPELSTESYVGWLALDASNEVIAGAGIHFMPQMPRISDDRTRVVTECMPVVQNVYTEPAWRHRGVARALMAVVMEWAATHRLDRLVLQASDAGRPLYVSLGFTPTREMGWSPDRLANTTCR